MGEAEAADAQHVEVVAARSGRARHVAARVFRAPREHAERQHGAGKRVAAIRRADERVDESGKVIRGGRLRASLDRGAAEQPGRNGGRKMCWEHRKRYTTHPHESPHGRSDGWWVSFRRIDHGSHGSHGTESVCRPADAWPW